MKRKNKFLKVGAIFVSIIAMFAMSFSLASFGGNSKNTEGQNTSAVSFIDSDAYIKSLLTKNNNFASEYSLADKYLILSENQSGSNLCWIYSSSKALETAIMVQRGEYYNFSETATALLNYKSGGSVNEMGDFEKFNRLTQNIGLVHEDSFSNDNFLGLTDENADKFLDSLTSVDSKFMENIKPILISRDVFFNSKTQDERIIILKNYLMTYGGFYSGLNTGKINASGVYEEIAFSNSNPQISANERAITVPHAVCIIGWDENKGWLALNSWGRATTSYEKFYIPFEVSHVYETASGYICVESESGIKLESSSANDFSASIVSGSPLKNVFVAGEQIELTYKVSTAYDFEELYINVFSAGENLTSSFNIEFLEGNYFKISSKPEMLMDYSGEYEIRFLVKGEVIKTACFYVYTGSELSYAELTRGASEVNGIQLNNTLSSKSRVSTFVVSDGGSSDIDFKLNLSLTGSLVAGADVTATLGEILETNTETGIVKSENTNIVATLSPQLTGSRNQFELLLINLARGNEGKLIETSITLKSTKTNHETKYYFKFIICSSSEANSSNASSVIYELGGGKNSEDNVTKLPVFSNEANMTEFVLSNPTRSDGAAFLGWYLDKEFENKVTKLDSLISSDVVLFAKWEESEVSYIDAALSIGLVLHYGEQNEEEFNAEDEIIYGDAVTLLLSLTANSSSLSGYNYYVRYHYFLDEKEQTQGTLKEIKNISFKNDFKKLTSGIHTAKIELTLVLNRTQSISITKTLEFEVKQKLVTVSLLDNEIKYDGKFHSPNIRLDGVYAEDEGVEAIIESTSGESFPVKNAKTYEFAILGVNNKNYTVLAGQTGEFKITKADFHISFQENKILTYNGQPQRLSYTHDDTGEDNVEIILKFYQGQNEIPMADCKNVGTYRIVPGIISANYSLVYNEATFVIAKAEAVVKFNSVEERYTVAPNNRTKISYTITGLAPGDTKESLNLSYTCDGLTAKDSGIYPIRGYATSRNYNVKIINGTYEILGYYHVYYKLPNGQTYDEIVDDGYSPKGITKDVYKAPFMSKIVYDKKLEKGSTDLVVVVSYKSYAWIIITVPVIIVIVAAYFILTRKTRRMKNR